MSAKRQHPLGPAPSVMRREELAGVGSGGGGTDAGEVSAKDVQAAMASLEDADDVAAGRALEKEAADEQLEFDDNAAKVGKGMLQSVCLCP